MHWVYISPHFDDVVLSCGGIVWEQVRDGQNVEVWTVCAGAPDPDEPVSDFALSLHARWETGPQAVPARRAEDEAAVRRLETGGRSIRTRYWDLPDCIYRRLPGGAWLVNGEEDLWKPFPPEEQGVVDRLAAWLTQGLPSDASAFGKIVPNAASSDTILVSPLTLGDHVDHFLVRSAVEQAARALGRRLAYYPDYPYAVKSDTNWTDKMGAGWQLVCQGVSAEALAAWQDAAACYQSQISTFWAGRAELDAALLEYWKAGGGTCLWQP